MTQSAAGSGLDVARGAEVGVRHADAERLERAAVQLASGADEIVETRDFDAGILFDKKARQRAAHKAADAGNDDSHSDALPVGSFNEGYP